MNAGITTICKRAMAGPSPAWPPSAAGLSSPLRPPAPARPTACTGFTLAELLVVIALIMLLAVLTVPAFKGISGGTNLTRAADETAGLVHLARQRAVTFNRQVAIRFYEKDDGFGSCQLWEKPDSASDPGDPKSWKAVGQEQQLPLGVIAKKDNQFSPLLAKFANNTEQKPRGNVKYAEVLFTPAGALVASGSEAMITFVPSPTTSASGLVQGLPPNFATLVIEPFNARPTIYRP